jgi:hypothetical protein
MPETIVLHHVLKPRLPAAFIVAVGVGILIVGRFFNWVLPMLTMHLSPNSKEARPRRGRAF